MRVGVSGGNTREFKKVTLTVSVENVQTFSNTMQRVLIKNLGVGSCYIDFDATASAASFELQEGDAYEFVTGFNTIHLFSTGTPKIQMMAFRG